MLSLERKLAGICSRQEYKQTARMATVENINKLTLTSDNNEDKKELKHHHDAHLKSSTASSSPANPMDPMDIPDTGCVVSGISTRLPSAGSLNELKQKLTDNCDMCVDHDDLRWPFALYGVPPRAGRLKNLDKFDAEFFGYKKERVRFIEHQLRILYEVIYESIVDAGKYLDDRS